MRQGANVHPDHDLSFMVESDVASQIRYKQRTFEILGPDVAKQVDKVTLDEVTCKLN